VALTALEAGPDAIDFDAVVLGSEVEGGGRWLPPALHWVGERSGQLRGRPVWLFSTHVPTPFPAWPRVGDGWWVADVLGAREHRSFAGGTGDPGDRTAETDWSVRIAAGIGERPVLSALR
jgi:hypothetical protein